MVAGVVELLSPAKRGEPCPLDGGCGKPVHSRGGCTGHYLRAYNAALKQRTGRTYKRLRGWDDYLRRAAEDIWPSNAVPAPLMPDSMRIGAPCNYEQAHRRVQYWRGRATDYPCRICTMPAHEWCYDHSDPNVLRGYQKRGKGAGMRKPLSFSANPFHYLALCRGCHFRMDKGRLRDVRFFPVA